MKAVKGKAGGVEVVEIDEPDGTGALVKIAAVSICASDLNYLRRGSKQVLGHEVSGFTEDGTPVIMEGLFGCGDCTWCRQGQYQLCELTGRNILGMTVPGAMAEYYRIPKHALIPVPAGLSVEDASLAEPGAVAWHAVGKGGVEAGSRVAVIGAGAIGILALLAARHPHQIELGERVGATQPSGDYDVVIEASGTESGLSRAFELARPQGAVCSVSIYPPDIRWPYRQAFLKEVRMIPSIGYCRHRDGIPEITHVAAMLAERPDIVRALITHRFGIDEAAQAFAVASDKSKGAFRVVVHP